MCYRSVLYGMVCLFMILLMHTFSNKCLAITLANSCGDSRDCIWFAKCFCEYYNQQKQKISHEIYPTCTEMIFFDEISYQRYEFHPSGVAMHFAEDFMRMPGNLT